MIASQQLRLATTWPLMLALGVGQLALQKTFIASTGDLAGCARLDCRVLLVLTTSIPRLRRSLSLTSTSYLPVTIGGWS